jgi:hypothetical protein
VVERSPKGDSLTVKLVGLTKLDSPLKSGLYQGLVYIGDKPLVSVILSADPSYSEGKPATK